MNTPQITPAGYGVGMFGRSWMCAPGFCSDPINNQRCEENMKDALNKRYGFRYEPDKILKSGSATIVFWSDGTKTVVKCADDEEPNDYNAFTAALAVKLFGTNSHVKSIIKNKTVIQDKKGQVK